MEVVLREASIRKETDLIKPTLLDELICHIASLASVYHKHPRARSVAKGSARLDAEARLWKK